MNSKRQYLTNLLLLLILCVNCSSPTIHIKKSFWNDNKNKSIAIVFREDPQPFAYKTGYQGIFDIFFNGIMSARLEEYLKELDISVFKKVSSDLKNNLIQKGFEDVIILPNIISDSTLPSFYDSCGTYCPKDDYRILKEEYSIDYIIEFSIVKYGTTRKYLRFTPLSPVEGVFVCKGSLIDLQTNEYIWNVETSEDISKKRLRGKSSGSPNYPLITTAIFEAMDSAKEFLLKSLFVEK